MPSHVKLVLGSSVNVNVMVAVSPFLSEVLSEVIENDGTVRSRSTTNGSESGLTFPAASVARAVKVCTPKLSSIISIDQNPPIAVPVPITVEPSVSYKVTDAPDSANP